MDQEELTQDELSFLNNQSQKHSFHNMEILPFVFKGRSTLPFSPTCCLALLIFYRYRALMEI